MVQKSGVHLISWYFFQLFTRLYTSKRWCRISFINSMYDSQTVSLLAFATYVLPLLLVYLTIVLPFSSVLAVDTSPLNTEKNTAGCGHGKNALWDAKRAWRPTYSLAIRPSNWLGKVWQKTKKGIYIYDRKNADIKNKVSFLRWLACSHELFVSMFCCFVPMLKWNLRFGLVDQRFSQCVLTIWNGKDETWKPQPWAEVTTLRWWNLSKS